MQVAGSLENELTYASFLASIEPVTVAVGTGIDLQGVRPVVEFVHRLVANRAAPLAGVGLVLNHAGEHDGVVHDLRFEGLEFGMDEPGPAALRTGLEVESSVGFGVQFSVSERAKHHVFEIMPGVA
jgi:hypothetical protein